MMKYPVDAKLYDYFEFVCCEVSAKLEAWGTRFGPVTSDSEAKAKDRRGLKEQLLGNVSTIQVANIIEMDCGVDE